MSVITDDRSAPSLRVDVAATLAINDPLPAHVVARTMEDVIHGKRNVARALFMALFTQSDTPLSRAYPVTTCLILAPRLADIFATRTAGFRDALATILSSVYRRTIAAWRDAMKGGVNEEEALRYLILSIRIDKMLMASANIRVMRLLWTRWISAQASGNRIKREAVRRAIVGELDIIYTRMTHDAFQLTASQWIRVAVRQRFDPVAFAHLILAPAPHTTTAPPPTLQLPLIDAAVARLLRAYYTPRERRDLLETFWRDGIERLVDPRASVLLDACHDLVTTRGSLDATSTLSYLALFIHEHLALPRDDQTLPPSLAAHMDVFRAAVQHPNKADGLRTFLAAREPAVGRVRLVHVDTNEARQPLRPVVDALIPAFSGRRGGLLIVSIASQLSLDVGGLDVKPVSNTTAASSLVKPIAKSPMPAFLPSAIPVAAHLGGGLTTTSSHMDKTIVHTIFDKTNASGIMKRVQEATPETTVVIVFPRDAVTIPYMLQDTLVQRAARGGNGVTPPLVVVDLTTGARHLPPLVCIERGISDEETPRDTLSRLFGDFVAELHVPSSHDSDRFAWRYAYPATIMTTPVPDMPRQRIPWATYERTTARQVYVPYQLCPERRVVRYVPAARDPDEPWGTPHSVPVNRVDVALRATAAALAERAQDDHAIDEAFFLKEISHCIATWVGSGVTHASTGLADYAAYRHEHARQRVEALPNDQTWAARDEMEAWASVLEAIPRVILDAVPPPRFEAVADLLLTTCRTERMLLVVVTSTGDDVHDSLVQYLDTQLNDASVPPRADRVTRSWDRVTQVHADAIVVPLQDIQDIDKRRAPPLFHVHVERPPGYEGGIHIVHLEPHWLSFDVARRLVGDAGVTMAPPPETILTDRETWIDTVMVHADERTRQGYGPAMDGTASMPPASLVRHIRDDMLSQSDE